MAKEGNPASKGARLLTGATTGTLCGGAGSGNNKRCAHLKHQHCSLPCTPPDWETLRKLNRLLARSETKLVAKTGTNNKGKYRGDEWEAKPSC